MCRLVGLHAGAHDVNATFWLLDALEGRVFAHNGVVSDLDELASGELLHAGPDLELQREIILDEPPRKPLSLAGRAADSQAEEH